MFTLTTTTLFRNPVLRWVMFATWPSGSFQVVFSPSFNEMHCYDLWMYIENNYEIMMVESAADYIVIRIIVVYYIKKMLLWLAGSTFVFPSQKMCSYIIVCVYVCHCYVGLVQNQTSVLKSYSFHKFLHNNTGWFNRAKAKVASITLKPETRLDILVSADCVSYNFWH